MSCQVNWIPAVTLEACFQHDAGMTLIWWRGRHQMNEPETNLQGMGDERAAVLRQAARPEPQLRNACAMRRQFDWRGTGRG